MVYVNSKKFACESCIKGHRSSSCHHTDRPLFEIKKKGRPVSQCTKCRELRQSKKLHSKCTCNHILEGAQATQPIAPSSGSKPRRFIPIVPALPNGLRDVLTQSSVAFPADSRQRVDSLLNPCRCKSVWKCKCRDTNTTDFSVPESHVPKSMDALSTLASAAAAMQCCTPSSSSSSLPSQPGSTPSIHPIRTSTTRPRSRPGSPNYASHKRQRQEKAQRVTHSPGPDLPPILHTPSLSDLSSSSAAVMSSSLMPNFATMPSMDEISSLAGSGCTCGLQCACPGCVEHRGSDHVSHERQPCSHGCGTCVDPSLGMSLPTVSAPSSSAQPAASNSTGAGSESFLDRFFARAAALPPPPVHRKLSSFLDPMDTTVYSNGQGFGMINLPKLECCGGQCNCPRGQCNCRTSCVGCCSDARQSSMEREVLPEAVASVPPPPVRSCCAGKA